MMILGSGFGKCHDGLCVWTGDWCVNSVHGLLNWTTILDYEDVRKTETTMEKLEKAKREMHGRKKKLARIPFNQLSVSS